jgi:DNA-binding NarL/FixJ family response regulator
MKIVLADDHELIRKGLKEVISALRSDWQVTEVASLSAALLQLSLEPATDIVLLDLYFPGSSGLDGLEKIQKGFPGIAVVIISSEENPEVVRGAIRSGASGYIPKSTSSEVMAKALELIIAGGVYVPPQVLSGALTMTSVNISEHPQLEPAALLMGGLSETQQKIAELIGRGLSNKDISEQMGFALQTVKNQVSRILRVTGLENRAALAVRIMDKK